MTNEVIELIKTCSEVVTAAGVAIAVIAMLKEDKARHVERAYDLMKTYHEGEETEDGCQIVPLFPERWTYPIKVPLTVEQAKKFWNVAGDGDTKSDTSKKYGVARKHLNRLEVLAFAYVSGTADRNILVRSIGGDIIRSNYYFNELIRLFGDKVGPIQSWQVIPQAVRMIERKAGRKFVSGILAHPLIKYD